MRNDLVLAAVVVLGILLFGTCDAMVKHRHCDNGDVRWDGWLSSRECQP